jgi:hypothetical protein
MSGDPLSVNVWGPHAWSFLHACTFAYDEQPSRTQQAAATQFFNNVGRMLPCKKCGKHYNEHLARDPVENHVSSKKSLTRWLVDLHNSVNRSCGKKCISYEKVCRYYDDWPELSRKRSRTRAITVVVILLIITIGVAIASRSYRA